MNDLNLQKLHDDARDRWLSSQRQGRKNVLSLIEWTVPFWLIVIAAAMYMLSAPHTAAIFDRLTPGFGWVAPLGVEFALLYIAFRQKQVNDPRLVNLQRMFGVISLIVNGAGSLMAVVNTTGAADKPIGAILGGFGELGITIQVGLLLVVFAAIAIPYATIAVGEGVATLIKEYNQGDQKYLDKWPAIAQDELYRAVYQELINQGVRSDRARGKASKDVANWFNQPQPSSTNTNQNSINNSKMSVQELVILLQENPHWLMMTDRALAVEVGCTQYTARTAKLMFKAGEQARESNDVNQ